MVAEEQQLWRVFVVGGGDVSVADDGVCDVICKTYVE